MKIEALRSKCYFDISIGSVPIGRIVFEVFDELAPRAVKSFKFLCTTASVEVGNKTGYKNTYFHRVVKNFIIQGGDIDFCKSNDEYDDPNAGCGGFTFPEQANYTGENLEVQTVEPFSLLMANNGSVNEFSSQFFITTSAQQHLSGKHTVFGTVIMGKAVVREIEKCKTDKSSKPLMADKVEILDCGEWQEGMLVPCFVASYDTIGNDIYEEYPEDDKHFDVDSLQEALKVANIIKESGTMLFKKGNKKDAFFKYRKSLRYVMEYIPDIDLDKNLNAEYEELKKKLYLNLSLSALQIKNFEKAKSYSTFLLEMDAIKSQDKAKAYYRRGTAFYETNKFELSIADLELANEFQPDDKGIMNQLSKSRDALQALKKKQQSSLSKFFK